MDNTYGPTRPSSTRKAKTKKKPVELLEDGLNQVPTLATGTEESSVTPNRGHHKGRRPRRSLDNTTLKEEIADTLEQRSTSAWKDIYPEREEYHLTSNWNR